MEDINSTFKNQLNPLKSGFDLALHIETKFVRNHPSDQKTAIGYQKRSLDLYNEDDC